MKPLLLCAASMLSLWLCGCHLPGKPGPNDIVLRPTQITSFNTLYGQNCAGCHGANGQNGPATDLANPEYEALIDDATLRNIIAHGETGTMMPGFAESSGGSLTDHQVDLIVQGMRQRWRSGTNPLNGQNPPPYKATKAGDAGQGEPVYQSACARCHGAVGAQPGPAGSVLDGSLLTLLSPQALRTTIIAGRPDIGQPDWRGDIPGHPLTDDEITNLAAWMMSLRPANPGQSYAGSHSAPSADGQPSTAQQH